MLHKTKIGVCMDDEVAYLLEEKNDGNLITIIEADETLDTEEENNPITIQRKRHNRNHTFFKRVFDIIRDFDNVALFCLPSAKNELMRRIKAHKLRDIVIQSKPIPGDKITENEKIEFINRYFETKT